MKKKIALLLAAVMTVSSLPMTLFAATINTPPTQYYNLQSNVQFLEDGWMMQEGSAGVNDSEKSNFSNYGFGATYTSLNAKSIVQVVEDGGKYSFPGGVYQAQVPYGGKQIVNGTSLIISSTTGFVEGSQFDISLSNATWDFGTFLTEGSSLTTKYDPNKGSWYADDNDGGRYTGTYYRGFGKDSNSFLRRQVPYDYLGLTNVLASNVGFGNPVPESFAGAGVAPKAGITVPQLNGGQAEQLVELRNGLKQDREVLENARKNDVLTASLIQQTFKSVLTNYSYLVSSKSFSSLNAIADVTKIENLIVNATSNAAITTNSSITAVNDDVTRLSIPSVDLESLKDANGKTFATLSSELFAALSTNPIDEIDVRACMLAVENWITSNIQNIVNADFNKNGAYLAKARVNTTNSVVLEVPYKLQVSAVNKNVATITLLASSYASTSNVNYQLNIPLVINADDTNNAVTASILNNSAGITTATYYITQRADNATKTWLESGSVKNVDEFRLDRITIEETRTGSINNSGWFTLTAPVGYRFVNNFNDAASGIEEGVNSNIYTNGSPIVRLSVGGGLKWKENTGSSVKNTSIFGINPISTTSTRDWYGIASGTSTWYSPINGVGLMPWVPGYVYNNSIPPYYVQVPTGAVAMGRGAYDTSKGNAGTEASLLDSGSDRYDYSVGYYYDVAQQQFDTTKVRIEFTNLQRATQLVGKLYIHGLKLVPNLDAQAEEKDLKVKIENGNAGIYSESFIIGERVQRNLSLTATPTNLISGRYSDKNYIDDATFKAGVATFKENAVNAWWSGRTTEFTLVTDGTDSSAAKFRKVTITDQENLTVNIGETNNYLGKNLYPDNTALNVAQNVRLTSNTLTLNNIFVTDYNVALFKINAWLSVKADYEGDVRLVAGGNGIGNADLPLETVIAKATPAVKVSLTQGSSSALIGYQEQDTSDIVIKETAKGALQTGKTITIDVTDRIYDDVAFFYFVPTTGNYVTDGNLTISEPKLANGTITFDVIKASSDAPATITFTGVKVKINRAAPQSSVGYDLYVGGNAIAANWDEDKVDSTGDKFNTMGVRPLDADGNAIKYIAIDYPANDQIDKNSGILTDRVDIAIGSSGYTKAGVYYDSYVDFNGEVQSYDAASYVSVDSNSTMVPFRMLAHAFGLDDTQISWNVNTETATIVTTSKVIQLKKGSDVMVINGAEIPMVSPDGLPVRAEIKDDRIYLPFRAMGNAFGVTVDWDGASKTAIYNPNGFNGN